MELGLAIILVAIGLMVWSLVKVSDDEDYEMENNE